MDRFRLAGSSQRTSPPLRFALTAICLSAAMLAGGNLASAESPEENNDFQDLVFLGKPRPFTIRFHIETDGRGFRTAWAEYVETLAAYLDENGDEVLSREEAERAPWQRLLREPRRSKSTADLMNEIGATPEDESVSMAQWLAFVRRLGGTFELAVNASAASDDDPLFDRLDRDRDGRISPDELADAPHRLRKLDLNDDDAISRDELAPPQEGMAADEAMESSPPAEHDDLLLLVPQTDRIEDAQRLLTRYDGSEPDGAKNGKLSAEEIGFAAAELAPFDRDGDGELNAGELTEWLSTREPDLEFTSRLGRRQRGTARLELLEDRTSLGEGPGGVQRVADYQWILWLGDRKLDLRVLANTVRPDAVVRFYQAHFFASDTDGNGYLTAAEGRESRIYRDPFENMDADGDEKLYAQEVLDYLQHRTEVTLRRTELGVESYGGTLLEVLDANRDNRLGVRELRDAFSMIELWDRDGDGHVARDEFPRELHLSLGQGRGELPGGVMVQAPEANMPKTKPVAPNAPFWFTKMDRNRDGDLSPREFLGSREVFGSLDVDGDGLLDSDEAVAAGSLSE